MGRITDAFDRAQGIRRSPQDPEQIDRATALECFSPNQAPATDPWEFAKEADPPTAPAEFGVLSTSTPEPLDIVATAGEHDVCASPELERLVLDARIPGFVKEQYHQLCARLHHAQLERGIRVVMVTSALPDEGKTLTASNLALTLSSSYGREVALIDGDLRRPTLHEIFSVSGVAPSSLFSATGPASLVTVRPQLAVLAPREPASDPLAVLASSRMRGMLAAARQRFEWVVIDTPPVGIMPDASVLSSMVDAVVIVALVGRTPYQAIQQACDAVGRDRVLGVVLNRADRRAVARAAYGYEQHYRT
jgi:capsular exopolysaccharide synthesis family protein